MGARQCPHQGLSLFGGQHDLTRVPQSDHHVGEIIFGRSIVAGEKELYESVAKFLQEALGCASTAINTGPRYAQIDVLGLCGRRSNFGSQTEVIAVEVKRGGTRFLHYVGQAVSYSLYCHRVYLAWEKPDGNCFTQEEIDIASKFGIGLLSISTECEIRLAATSTEFRPEHHRVLEAIDRLKYFQCTICHAHYPKERSVWINQPGAINTSVESELQR